MLNPALGTRDYFGSGIVELARFNKSFVVIGCDLGLPTRTLEFRREFPDRFIECGNSEANALSIAAGLAQEGIKPLICSFSHFLTSRFLEIFQSIGLNNAPVVLVGTHIGLAIGKDGPTQMGLRDLGLIRLLPNFKIIQPCDGVETQEALKYCLSNNSPAYLRLGRQPAPRVLPDSYKFKFSKMIEVVEGRKLAIITYGGLVSEVLKVAETFNNARTNKVGVINVSSLPYEERQLSKILNKYKSLLIVEDQYYKGGLFDEVAAFMVKSGKSIPVKQVAVTDYAQSGRPEDLYRHYRLDVASIKKVCKQLLSK